MRKILYTMTALVALGGTTAVSAEAVSATTEAGVTAKADVPAADAAVETDAEAQTFTDAEVASFAQAVIAANEVEADATIAAEEKSDAMVAAVQATGIDPATYNDIASALADDSDLQQRIAAAIQAQSAPADAEATAEADG